VTSTRTATVQQAIDEIGHGRFQRRLLAVCGVTWAADAAEVLLVGFELDAVTGGLLATAGFVGMLFGAWFWGPAADRIGRRRGFVVTVAIFAVFGLAAAFAPSPGWLMTFRFLAGFGLGGALPLDFSLYAEYLPSHNRGRRLVLLESFWALGTIVAAGLAWLLVPTVGWRPLMATSAVAALLVLWIRARVPESPRWLVVAGRPDEARAAVIAQVAAVNGRPMPADVIVSEPPAERVGVRTLFVPRLRRITVVLWLSWFGIALGYYGLFSWLPTVFVQQGYSFLASYGYAFVLALAQVPGYFSAAWLIERWGRRPTIGTYLLVSAAGTFVFALAPSTALLLIGGIARRLGRAVRVHARAVPDVHARHGVRRRERDEPDRRCCGPGGRWSAARVIAGPPALGLRARLPAGCSGGGVARGRDARSAAARGAHPGRRTATLTATAAAPAPAGSA
jgi:putative MFS transporter